MSVTQASATEGTPSFLIGPPTGFVQLQEFHSLRLLVVVGAISLTAPGRPGRQPEANRDSRTCRGLQGSGEVPGEGVFLTASFSSEPVELVFF